jgi:hypothetical protein
MLPGQRTYGRPKWREKNIVEKKITVLQEVTM